MRAVLYDRDEILARTTVCVLPSVDRSCSRTTRRGSRPQLLADRYGYRTTDDDAEPSDVDPEELAVEVDRCVAYPDPVV